MVLLTIYKRPIPLNQIYRVNRYGVLYKTKLAKQWVDDVREILSHQFNDSPITTPVNVTIKVNLMGNRKMDIDAPLKLLLDSMNELIFIDDSQIESLIIARKMNCESDYIKILIN